MNNIDYFKLDIHVGDIASIELTSGKSISGKILEINKDFVLLETEAGKSMRLLDGIIGGWELITKEEIDNSEEEDELETEVKIASIELIPITRSQLAIYQDNIMTMFRSLLSKNIKLSSPLDSNAVISAVNDDVILATHDNGSQLLIGKNSLIGYYGVDVERLKGKRLFCVSSGNPQKATRSKSNILSISYSDLSHLLDEELNKGNVTLVNRLFKIIKRFPSFAKCHSELKSIKTEFLKFRSTRVLLRANQSFLRDKRHDYISFVSNYLNEHQTDIEKQLAPLIIEIERVYGCRIPRRYLLFTIQAIQLGKEDLLFMDEEDDTATNDIETLPLIFHLNEDDVQSLCKECLSLYKQIILSTTIRPAQIIEHNSTVIGPSSYDVDYCVAQNQDKQTVFIRREGFVGVPSIHLKNGALIFSILREPTSDSVATIGLINYNTLNQYYAKSINERTFIEALSIVRYLLRANSFVNQQKETKALLDKVYMLYKYSQNLRDNGEHTNIEPIQLKNFVSFLIQKENHKKPLSDQGIADTCHIRFGRSVELKEIEVLRNELGIGDQASRLRLYQDQKIQKQSETFDDSGCFLLKDIIGNLVNEEDVIPTNAEILLDEKSAQFQAETDDGNVIDIQKNFFIGDLSALQVEHTRLLAKPQVSGKCFVCIQEQTYGDLLLLYNRSLLDHRYQDVISIIKALRSIPRFSAVDDKLREIYTVAKDGVQIESKKQIVDYVDLSEDERSALETLTQEMIDSEDKNNPFTDYQIAGEFNSRYNIVLNVSAIGIVRNELGIASAIERKNQSLFIESNCYIDKYFIWYNNGAARNDKYPEIRFKDEVVDPELLSELESFRKGSPSIPAVCATVVDGRHVSASFMVKPGSFHELTQKARAFETSGNVSTAEAIRKFLSNWEKSAVSDSDDSSIIYGRAREMRQNREYSGAERLFGVLVERNYQLDTVVKDLSDMYREMNQLGKAIEIMEKHVDKMSNKLKAYNFMSGLYSTAGLYSSSIECIEKTIDLVPSKNRHLVYYNLANLCVLNKDIESARKYIESAIKLKPTNNKYKELFGKLTAHRGAEIVRLEKSLTFKMPLLVEYDIRNINLSDIGEEAARLLNKIKTSEQSQVIEEKRNSIIEYTKARYSYQLSSACIESAQDYMLANQSIRNTGIVSAGIVFLMTYLVSDPYSIQETPLPMTISSLINKFTPGTNAKLPTAMAYLLSTIDKSCLPSILKDLHKNLEWGQFICRSFSLPETKDEKEFVVRLTKIIERFQSEFDSICRTLQRISISESPHKQYKELVDLISEHSTHFLHQTDIDEVQNLLRIIQQVEDTIKCDNFRIVEDGSKRLKETIMTTIKGIGKRPTTLSAVYVIPVLERCNIIVDSNLTRLASLKAPSLDIISIAPARESDNKCSLILKASNKEGHAPATLTSIRITEMNGNDVTSKAYNHGSRRLLYGGDDYTFEINISLSDNDIASHVLNSVKCNVIYYDKDSKEYSVDIQLNPIRIDDSLHFKPYDNKFLKWANGKEVQDVNMMKGRDDLINHIASTALEEGKNFIIYGQRRSGKSTVLYHVKERLSSIRKCFVAEISLLGLSANEDEEESFLGDLYYEILSGIQNQIRKENREVYLKEFGLGLDCDEIRNNPNAKFSYYLNRIKDVIIERLGYENDRIILLIDEFTQLYQEILDKHISGVFVQKMKGLAEAGSITFVLSGHDVMPKFVEAFPNEFAIFEKIPLTCIKEKYARELIEMPVWDYESNISRFDLAAVDYLVELTACSPFYIQILCAKIVEYANNHSISIITEFDAKTVVDELINTQKLTRGNFDNLIPIKDNKKFHEQVYGLSMNDVSRVCYEVAQFNQEYVPRTLISSVKSISKLKEIIRYLHDRDVIDYHPHYGSEYIRIKVSLFKEWLRKNEI